jgi:hypothetical protein
MRKPDFFIVGAPKCGTSALYAYLGRHPDVFMSPVKEPHYFATDLFPNAMTAGDYLALFATATGQKRVGEASVSYLYSREAPGNIQRFCPTARVIIMLRNPVDMIYSLHSQMYFTGDESIADFEEALAAEADRKEGRRIAPIARMPREFFCYRELGRYNQYVQRYLQLFGTENVLVIDFDQFHGQTGQVFRETCQFLDVDPDVPMAFPRLNENKNFRSQSLIHFLRNPPRLVGNTVRALLPLRLRRAVARKLFDWNVAARPRPPLRAELREALWGEFAPDVEDLGRTLARSFRHWAPAAAEPVGERVRG